MQTRLVRDYMGKRGSLAAAVCLLLCTGGQDLLAQRNRIAAQAEVDRRNMITLRGHVHPAATPANDRGRADAAMPMPSLTLMLTPSAEQQKALDDLLAHQQDTSSPDYHHWLTPEEYADRFGFSRADIGKITSWLESEGLTVISVARGRNSITFRGQAGQVSRAFSTEIHRYMVQGEMHYANATEPSIPAVLNGVVGFIRGLHDFRPKARALGALPRNTSGSGRHYIAPDDAAIIYDIKPLYGLSIDGSGQKIAVVGQTDIALADIQQFRTYFNLPASDPQQILVPGLPDPGTSQSDIGEADLDIETAGGIARGATVIYVYSLNVDDAIVYAINNNVAPVLSSSYGLCEAATGKSFSMSQQILIQQGNSQGITFVSASGDSGAVDCYSDTSRNASGLSIDEPSDIPEVTSVGGTTLTEGSGTYWNPSNDSNHASALSYIPETTWNDSATDTSASGQNTPSSSGGGVSIFFSKPSWQSGVGVPNDGFRDVPDISLASSADHDGFLVFSGGGTNPLVFGGTSVAAPLFAGIVTLLNQYQVVNGLQKTAGMGNVNPRLYALASSAPDAFHDITTGNNIVDPCGARVRNCTATPVGYSAGAGYDQATGLGSIDAFRLISDWNQQATKSSPTLNLTASAQSIPLTGSVTLTATLAGSGTTPPSGTVSWSFANGSLGSASLSAGKASITVQGSQLSAGTSLISVQYSGDGTFTGASGTQSITVTAVAKTLPTLALFSSAATIPQTGSAVLTATITSPNGLTPTGTVVWSVGGISLGSANLAGSAGTARAAFTLLGSQVTPGVLSISAVYNGDASFNTISSTLPLTVTGISGATNSASFKQVYAPGMIMSVFGAGLAAGTEIASTVPLPTQLQGATATVIGIKAPLYFAAAGQINLQIPYEVPASSHAPVAITFGGQTYTTTIAIASAAPGIFYNAANGAPVPDQTAARGQTIEMFVTGEGAVAPQPVTGSLPAPGTIPVPVQSVSISVGGVTVPPPFAFIGMPSWSIGATQLNFTVPANVPLGPQAVIVTVGGVPSAPATLTITN